MKYLISVSCRRYSISVRILLFGASLGGRHLILKSSVTLGCLRCDNKVVVKRYWHKMYEVEVI